MGALFPSAKVGYNFIPSKRDKEFFLDCLSKLAPGVHLCTRSAPKILHPPPYSKYMQGREVLAYALHQFGRDNFAQGELMEKGQ